MEVLLRSIENVKPITLFKIAQLVAFPVLLAIHGAYWLSHGESLAFSVYAMKLVYLPFLAISLLCIPAHFFGSKAFTRYLLLILPVFLISLSAPFILGLTINYYYFTDAIGLAVTLIAVPVSYLLLRNGLLSIKEIEQIFAAYLLVVSLYIVLYFIVGAGEKLSITPEMTLPMAIVLSAYVFPSSPERPPSIWLIFLIAVACVLSQLRENMMAFLLVAVLCGVRERGRRSLTLLGLATIVVVTFLAVKPNVFDRPAFFRKMNIEGTIINPSIDQRRIEIELMLLEMRKSPESFVLGVGFGATYENTRGELAYYGERVHNAHSTPFVVYFRNGAYGVALFVLPLTAAVFLLWSKRQIAFRMSLCALIFYGVMVFNQYLYWNVQYGLLVALIMWSSRKRAT
jgi:hypothetical protein